MKVIDILNFNKRLFQNLIAAGINPTDIRYIDLYSEYTRMATAGEKISYIVTTLAEKYSISERSVYTVIKRLQKDCNLISV